MDPLGDRYSWTLYAEKLVDLKLGACEFSWRASRHTAYVTDIAPFGVIKV